MKHLECSVLIKDILRLDMITSNKNTQLQLYPATISSN